MVGFLTCLKVGSALRKQPTSNGFLGCLFFVYTSILSF
jgi:hypothetical protein